MKYTYPLFSLFFLFFVNPNYTFCNESLDSMETNRLLSKADSLFGMEKFDEAEVIYTDYLDEFKDGLSVEEKGYVYNQLMTINLNAQDYKKGKNLLNEIESTNNQIDTMSSIYLNSIFLLGELYKNQREGEQAIFYYEKINRVTKKVFVDSVLLEKTYEALGYCNRHLQGKAKEAIFYYRLQEEILDKFSSAYMKKKIKNKYNLSAAYRMNEEYGIALLYAKRALELGKEKFPEDISFQAKCLSIIGNISVDLRDFEEAYILIKEAILLSESIKNDDQNLIFYYYNFGRLNMIMKNYNVAIEYLEKNLRLTDAKYWQVDIYFSLGECFMAMEEFDKALYYVEQSIIKGKKEYGSNHPYVSLFINKKGEIFEANDKPELAVKYYQESITLTSTTFKDTSFFANPTIQEALEIENIEILLLNKARALRKVFLKTSDYKYLDHSVDIFNLLDNYQQQKIDYSFREGKLHDLDKYHQIYSEAIETNKQQKITIDKRNSNTFYYLEKSKANLLWKRYNSIRLTKERKALQANRKVSNDSLHFARLNHKPITLVEYQKWLRENNSQSIIYHLNERLLHITLISGDKFISISNLVNEKFDVQIQSYLDILEGSTYLSNPIEVFRNHNANAFLLYETLIKPIEKDLASEKNMIIIPDGKIALIPFDALIAKDSITDEVNYKTLPYLLKKYNIHYAFSATTLIQQETVSVEKSRPIKNILGLSYSDENSNNNYNTENYSDLPNASNELEVLGNIFKNAEVTLLNGIKASKKNLLKNLPNKDLIHLVTHAEGNGKINKIIFQDSEISLQEIYNLPSLQTRFLFLSGCQTGVGKYEKGESINSLAKGFSFVGVPSIVTSFWSVNNQSAIAIVKDFYRNVQQYQPSIALSKAKQKYLKNTDGVGAFPGNWATFQLIGSNEFLIKSNFYYWTKYILLGIILIASFTFYNLLMNRVVLK